jgi:hypothetical protein
MAVALVLRVVEVSREDEMDESNRRKNEDGKTKRGTGTVAWVRSAA